jgi:hypothetical protein
MHYVTHKPRWMQKHRFGITCPSALFVETASGPPEHEKLCINVLHSRCTGMYYVTHRSHRMQKHKFGVTCPSTLVMVVKSLLSFATWLVPVMPPSWRMLLKTCIG